MQPGRRSLWLMWWSLRDTVHDVDEQIHVLLEVLAMPYEGADALRVQRKTREARRGRCLDDQSRSRSAVIGRLLGFVRESSPEARYLGVR